MRINITGLWRERDFLKLWAGRTISLLGDQITFLAFPLIAVQILDAKPFQMGILRALYSAASVFVGLFAGVWIDRVKRRPVLVWTDLGFTLLYTSIPIAAILGLLRIEQLYVLQFLSGTLWVFSDVAQRSFLPLLVLPKQLVSANSKLGFTRSLGAIIGPTLAGLLVQVVTAPIAMIFDALSFLLSAIFVQLIRIPEHPLESVVERQNVWVEIRNGLRLVLSNPLLRPLAEAQGLHHLFASIIDAMFVLYAAKNLGIEAALLGIVFSGYGPGFLLAALLATRMANRLGIGPSVIIAALLNTFGMILLPLANGPTPMIVSLLFFAHFLYGVGLQIGEINSLSLRQAITPSQFQGRMNASFRFLYLGMDLIGALVAGALGETIGLRGTLLIAASGLFLPFLRLLFSPLRNLRQQLE